MYSTKSFILLFLAIPFSLFSSGTGENIEAANKIYLAGDYNQALTLYEEAEMNSPESPYIYFNKGITFFRLEDYEKAKEAFLSAARKTKDLKLEARAYYNLGNTNFFEANRHVETDLKKAIELFQEAITNYQVALERDKKIPDAAHNIEVTRLIVRDLLDKLKKQQEQNAEQQEKIKEIAEKIAELIGREERTIEYTQNLKEEKDSKGVSQTLRNNADKVKKEQQTIRKETVDVSGQLTELISQGGQPQGAPQQGGTPLHAAKEHVDLSANFQQLAENQLQKTDMAPAVESEGKAREELVKALEALAGDQQQDQQQQQQQQDKEQKQKEEETEAQAKDAEDIIDEEKEERRERQVQGQGGYREVERDW